MVGVAHKRWTRLAGLLVLMGSVRGKTNGLVNGQCGCWLDLEEVTC